MVKYPAFIGLLGAASLTPAATIRDDVPDADYTAYSAQPQYAAAGYVEVNGGQLFGSGTLIAPDWVLTAAHVVTQQSNGTPAFPAAEVTFGQGANSGSTGLDTGAQIVVESGWSYNLGAGNDLALIKLSTPITNVAPAELYSGSMPSELGQIATIVGYGRTGTGLTGDVSSHGARRAVQDVVDGFGGLAGLPVALSGVSSNLMFTDFDQPNNPLASVMGGSTPLMLEGAEVPGDSGGGLYLTVGGETYLAGVTDFVGVVPGNLLSINADGHYGDYNGFTRLGVAQSAAFINAALATPASWTAAGGGTWASLGNWSGGNMPEFAGATATFGGSIAGPATITLDVPWTVGAVNFDNAVNSYTLAAGAGGGGMLTLDNNFSGSAAAVTVTSGNHLISAPMALNSNVVVTVTNPGDGLKIIGAITGSGGVTLSGSGTLSLNGVNSYSGGTSVNTGALKVGSAGALPGGSALAIGSATSTGLVQFSAGMGEVSLGSLAIGPGSTLDIADNILAINYTGASPVAAIAAAVVSGYNNGNWTGPGITSSVAAQNAMQYTVAFADGNVDADTVAEPNQVIVRYTLLGDANLDGTVDFSDLVVLAQQFGTSGNDWAHGNFTDNPQGTVGFADLVDVAQNIGDSMNSGLTPVLSAAFEFNRGQISGTSVVPEPGITGVAGVAVGGLLAMRRRRRNRPPQVRS